MRWTRYPEYKPSGVEWMGDVPAHWSVANLRRFAAMRTGHTPSRTEAEYWQDCNIPWFTLADVWQIRDSTRIYLSETKEKISELGLENSAAELLPAGTVVLSRTASVGFSGIMPVPMATSQDFWNWLCDDRLLPEYLLYLFRAMQPEFARLTMGSTHKTIYEADAASLVVCVPPTDEQRSIVRFLDERTQRIDALVARKERLIRKFKEKREALISRTVTRGLPAAAARSAGLNPEPKLKPSAVAWIDEVPEHWTLTTLRRLAISYCDGPFGSGLKSEHYTEDGIRVVRLQNIGFAVFRNLDKAFIEPEYYAQLGDHDVLAGDLLVAGLGDENNAVGRACVAPRNIEPAMVKADCFRFRLDQHAVDPQFLALQLTAAARSLAGAFATGTTRARMNLSATAARHVLLPPLEEQRVIVAYLRRENSHIDALEDKVARAIRKLQLYKIALIASAAAGKIDVRSAGIASCAPIDDPEDAAPRDVSLSFA